MVDHALENAQKRRDELAAKINSAQQQVEEWRRELARVDTFIHDWHSFAGEASPLQKVEALPIPKHIPVSPKKKATNNSKKEDVAREVRKIIEERARPVLRSELYAALVERGYTIEGTDPEMVLSTMLWRAGKDAGVIRLGKGGYWLVEKDWPEARYHPSLSIDVDDLLGSNPIDE